MKDFGKLVGGIIVAALLFATLVFAGWQAGWWFQAENTQRQRDINKSSQSYQDSLVRQERDLVNGITTAADKGQKELLTKQFCSVYTEIVNPPADLAAAHSSLC
jgi:hypothetical protein